MYKILHLFAAQKFTYDFIKLIYNNFDIKFQEIWVFGPRDPNISLRLLPYENVKYIKNIDQTLKNKEIYKFDKIFYHGIFEQNIIDFFYENKSLLGRLYLYFWGGDKFKLENKKNNYRKKYIIKNSYGIINVIPEEKRYMQKEYQPKGKFYCIQYDCKYELLQDIKKNLQKKKEYIAIQVGNSATPSNHHIYIFNLLSKFKDKNIKIYAPLSYGNNEYAKKVIIEGKKIFGEKFIGLKKYMNEEEYYQFLNSMDVAIFDMNRQQALGNIYALLYFGKKVFLKEHSVLTHFIKVEKHCDVYTTDNIEQMNFEEFFSLSEACKKNNEERMREICKIEPIVMAWDDIFKEQIKRRC